MDAESRPERRRDAGLLVNVSLASTRGLVLVHGRLACYCRRQRQSACCKSLEAVVDRPRWGSQ
jgi:hypothetical protein